MNPTQKDQIVERLAARLQQGAPSNPADRYIHDALRCMVEAGACRIGMRADLPLARGFSACELAPPMARLIDHTALKAETTEDAIRQLCQDAEQYCFASVCVNPCYVPLAAERLAGSPVAVCTVIGFPLGATQTAVKATEAELAVRDGATEVDMVLNVGMLKSARHEYVEKDVRAVVEAARSSRRGGTGTKRALVKVILETALLTDEEKVIACVLAQNAGADFVKTSTGFSRGGATAADVAMMRRVVGEKMGVKASGGVRTLEEARTMVAHGATRIGASASVAIIKGLAGGDGY
jgi:deoxyribose-phosphate aldolase